MIWVLQGTVVGRFCRGRGLSGRFIWCPTDLTRADTGLWYKPNFSVKSGIICLSLLTYRNVEVCWFVVYATLIFSLKNFSTKPQQKATLISVIAMLCLAAWVPTVTVPQQVPFDEQQMELMDCPRAGDTLVTSQGCGVTPAGQSCDPEFLSRNWRARGFSDLLLLAKSELYWRAGILVWMFSFQEQFEQMVA